MDEPPRYGESAAGAAAASSAAAPAAVTAGTPTTPQQLYYPPTEGYKEMAPLYPEPEAHVVAVEMLPTEPVVQAHVVAHGGAVGQPMYYAPPAVAQPPAAQSPKAQTIVVAEPPAGMPPRTGADIAANILWATLGCGLFLFIMYVLTAALICVTIIGIPLGTRLFRHSFIVLAPFGITHYGQSRCSAGRAAMTFLWTPFAIALYLLHLGFGLMMMLTIVLIPFGLMNIKLGSVLFWPFDHKYVANPVRFGALFTPDYYFSPPTQTVVTVSSAAHSV